MKCKFESCKRAVVTVGVCMAHYQQCRRGKVLSPIRPVVRGASLSDRFWSKVRRSRACWEWTGATRNGYGAFSVGNRQENRLLGAHRIAWEIQFGAVPDGLHVLHKCDNRKCVRPAHLFVGTPKDNLDDMSSKDRWRNQWGEGKAYK